jgi:hypothetical protein
MQRASEGAARAPWLLVVPVTLLHLWLAWQWWQWQAAFGFGGDALPRLQVAFVRDLLPAAPPPVPPRAPPPARATKPAPAPASSNAPASAARAQQPHVALPPPAQPDTDSAPLVDPRSQAAPPESAVPIRGADEGAPGAAAAATESAPVPVAALPAGASAPVGAAPAGTSVAAPSPAFEWPPSTRLSYLLTGNYQGPVEGQASVEWRLAGERYQVEVEVSVGPFFAPIVSRTSLSDGLVTPEGLAPRRYEEETRVAFRAPRRLSLALGPERLRLASGAEPARPPGLQDTASQFVQMTWLFTVQPERLREGELIRFPLALPRQVLDWTYEVGAEVTLETPVGPLPAWHVRPRPPAGPGTGTATGAVLLVEFWVAPTLQYLPVRVIIRQDPQTFVDLLLRSVPQQAERAASAPR